MEEPATTGEDGPERRQAAAGAWAALTAVVLVFYDRLWLPDLVLVKRDAFRFFSPMKQYAVDRLADGELPQWFPYEALGRPFIGVATTGAFSPFLPLYMLLPVPDAHRAVTLLCCLLAAWGAFALGRLVGLSPWAAVVAGTAFACSGYVASLTDNFPYLYSVCVLPWFCAGLERALTRSGAWVVAPAAVWATVFLNGDIQTGYYYGFVAMLWALARRTGPLKGAGARVAAVGVLALLLAAVQLAPSASVFLHSHRLEPGEFHREAVFWSTHPLRLVSLVASPVSERAGQTEVAHHFFGGRPPGQPPNGYWAESLYIGIPVAGLALLGLARRDLQGLAWLAGAAALLALGRYGGLYEVFYRAVPLWSAFRYPEKLMGLVAFGLAMLAGAGADRFLDRGGRGTMWFAAAGASAAAALSLPAAADAMVSSGLPDTVVRDVTAASARAFAASASAACLTGVLAAAVRGEYLRAPLAAGLLIVTIAGDLLHANARVYHTGPRDMAELVPPFVGALERHGGRLEPGRFRILTVEEATLAYPPEAAAGLTPAGISSLFKRHALDLEHNALFGLESIKASMPGYRPEMAALADLARDRFGAAAYGRFNVAYFIGQARRFGEGRFAEHVVAREDAYGLVLAANPAPVKPRAYLSRKPERAESPVDLAALIARPDFLDGTVDVVESPDGPLPGPAPTGTAVIRSYRPEEVLVRVETPQPAVLVLLDAYDEGWRAVLDASREVPVLRANGVARAVVVPAGVHDVAFAYRTPWLAGGAMLSGLGILACLGVPFALRRNQAGVSNE